MVSFEVRRTRTWYDPVILNDAEIPAITPVCTATVPVFSGRATEASGFGAAVTQKPPEIFRLPCPETVQTSFTPSSFKSSTPAGITNPEMVWPVASPRVGSPAPSGNALQYSSAIPPFASIPNVSSPDEPLTPRSSAPCNASET